MAEATAGLGEGLKHLCVGVMCFVGEDRRAVPQVAQQLFSHRWIGSLASGELKPNRSAICIDKSVDLCRQAAARTSHARIGRSPFLALAPCW